ITTHSNHLLDLTLDIQHVSVYTFKRNGDLDGVPQFVFENVDNDSSEVLRLLGVRNSSVFLTNCTIWVEGITDRIYLRRYLELYISRLNRKIFKEDIHYSFVEYGGSNITHWSFLSESDESIPNIIVDRLCGKLFLITDRDGAGLKMDGSPDS